MYYELEAFGTYVRQLRNNLKYTQKDVSNLAFVSVDTLRKIENGKVLANQSTLEDLSTVLKEDLNSTLLKFRLGDYKLLSQKINNIEDNISNGNYTELEEDSKELKKILGSLNVNSYKYIYIKQLSLIVESVILKTINFQYRDALDKLTKGIKLTTPSFSIETYKNFTYSDIEIRILMNMALLINILGNIDLCQDILIFSLHHLKDSSTDLNLRILFNLSYTFHRKGLHKKALIYANKGIVNVN